MADERILSANPVQRILNAVPVQRTLTAAVTNS